LLLQSFPTNNFMFPPTLCQTAQYGNVDRSLVGL
jgi:hypothetical protein